MNLYKKKIGNFWAQLSNKNKIIIFSLVSLFLLFMFFSPKYKELERMRSEKIKIKSKLDQKKLNLIDAQNEAKNIQKYEREYIEIKSKIDGFKKSLMSERDLINLINILTFRENDIDYLLFISEPIEDSKVSKRLPIKIELEATYFLLSKYIDYIEQSNFIIDIKKFNIEKKKNSYDKIKASLLLAVYISK